MRRERQKLEEDETFLMDRVIEQQVGTAKVKMFKKHFQKLFVQKSKCWAKFRSK